LNPKQQNSPSARPASIGDDMYGLAHRLFPICRSLTGDGVRRTLSALGGEMPNLAVHEVPSGALALDWTVPDEWNIRSAWIDDESGARIVDFANHNLHVMGYSEPVDTWLSLDELQEHLYSLPERPDAIPYVTSYYKRRWGFCLPESQRQELKPGRYHVHIDSDLGPGRLNYGELILPGQTEEEVLLSTYVCHPSMANNELSGPCVATYLAKWLMTLPNRRYTYRILFLPETIGAIVYLSRHLETLKRNLAAGFVLTCIGDDRAYSYLSTRQGNSLADRVARHVLGHIDPGYKAYSFLERGSDERQYNSPGADLPVCSVMRSKYGEYPEYHTSDDDLSVISPAGLQGGFEAVRKCIECLEANHTYCVTTIGEPQLGKHDLYPSISTEANWKMAEDTNNLIGYCDGENDLISVADTIGRPLWELLETVSRLKAAGLLRSIDSA
jgi:aminopeptidase-like protein